jgi:hypothetical protein
LGFNLEKAVPERERLFLCPWEEDYYPLCGASAQYRSNSLKINSHLADVIDLGIAGELPKLR